MKKAFRKALSILLVTVMLVSSAPLAGFVGLDLPDWLDFSKLFEVEAEAATSGYYTYSVSNGEATITDVSESISGAIIIPSTLGGYPVTSIGDFAFWYCDSLTSVTIGDGVKSIGYHAFYSCDSLTSVTIPDSVTSIGDYAFYSCSALIRITIGSGVTSIGDYSFGCCFGLISLSVDKYNANYSSDGFGVLFNKNKTELIQYPIGNSRASYTIPDSVISIGAYAFEYCDNLTGVTIGDSVKSIGHGAFYSCDSLTSVTIPDSVTSIGVSSFRYCTSLTSITFGNSVTTIDDYAFRDCDRLTSVTIPDSVKSIGYSVFEGCDKLINVKIGNGVTSIGSDLFYATPLYKDETKWSDSVLYVDNYLIEAKKTISGDYSIKSGTKVIANWAFSSCDNLTSINIPDSVKNIGYGAVSCTMLEKIVVDSKNSYYWSDENGVLYSKDKTTLYMCPCNMRTEEYVVPEETTTISARAFYGVKSLKHLVLSDNVNLIDIFAINNCDNLLSVTTSTAYNANISTCGGDPYAPCGTDVENHAISECDVLEVIILPQQIKTIGKYALSDNPRLKVVHIPCSVTEIYEYVLSGSPAYICSTTGKCYVKTYCDENKIDFKLCSEHDNTDIYNLGEETYSFTNFKDADSKGHCFGMSMTSSGYYTGILDISLVGGTKEKDLYALSKTTKVTTPICYYQKAQNYRDKATVAGGSWYKAYNSETYTGKADISKDWAEVVNYVKNHSYDNKGNLQIGYRKEGVGSHAVNFLYYAEVNGQQRIYAYDSNFPDIETYFYMGTDGYVYQAPKASIQGSIDCIALRNVEKYFELASQFDELVCAYAEKDAIRIDGAEVYALECGSENGEQVMYVFPQNASRIIITPLKDNAAFMYLDEEYSFGEIDDDTVGILNLAVTSDQKPSFIIADRSELVEVSVRNPSTTTIKYGDGIVLHADVNEALPSGWKIKWSADNGNFDYTVSADGTTCTITPSKSGDTTFTVTVYDENGNEISKDTQTMKSKAGFFDKFAAFFRKLFGLTKVYPEAFNG